MKTCGGGLILFAMASLMFQKIGYTLEHKLKSMMQSTESCNSDNHNLLKQQFIIYSEWQKIILDEMHIQDDLVYDT